MDWPKQLVDVIARRRCVLFLGAGLSCNAQNAAGLRPPSWPAFLTKGIDRVPKKARQEEIKGALRRDDYLLACELLKKALGENDFIELLKDEFERPRFAAASVHEDVFKLDSRIVLTPNVDKLYDTYAMHETHGTMQVKHYDDGDLSDAIRRGDGLILKLHGCLSRPQKVIFTQTDYATARTAYATTYRLVEALLETHTFVFLGAGIHDPDLRLLLENYHSTHHAAMPHYFVCPTTMCCESVREVYASAFNLMFLTYDPRDDHKAFADGLKELVTLVENERAEVAKFQTW